ncbi:MAG: hypoxanthine phosphoribosyltransferase [Endomicrobiia bacterium]
MPNLNILITEEEIKNKVTELAKNISKDYKGKNLLIVGILKGSSIFLSDLIRKLTINCEIDFVALRSYNSKKPDSFIQVILDLYKSPAGKDVLIVDDILDTGRTLEFLKKNLLARNTKSVKICVLLNKIKKRNSKIKADYKGFDIPDKFVVGYGLDFKEKYRNLPYIATIK